MRDFPSQKIPKPSLSFDLEWLKRDPIDLEIGAGQGLHAIRYANANPERLLFAVEKTNIRFERMNGRFLNHQSPQNLKVFHADAVAFTTHFLKDESLARIFLLYPNPYPKPKQANLRWHNRPFMRLLLARLKVAGTLTLATNLKWYAEEAAKNLVDIWGLELCEFSKIDAKAHMPRTHFEKKYLERGEDCFNLVLRKSADYSSIKA